LEWRREAYRTAAAYIRSMNGTYRGDVARSVLALSSYDCTGLTADECYAMAREAGVWVRLAKKSLRRHLAFMQRRPATACFRDAYARDRSAATTLTKQFSNWRVGNAGEMRYRNQRLRITYSGIMRSFVNRYKSYFRDCHFIQF
jgi:hypothetical protein